MKKAKKPSRTRVIAKNIFGVEPKPRESTRIELITLLNYYANNFDYEKSKAYLIKHPEFEKYKGVDDKYFLNYGFLYRILDNGFNDADDYIKSYLEKAKAELEEHLVRKKPARKVVPQQKPKIPNIRRIQDLRECGGLAEALLDMIYQDQKQTFSGSPLEKELSEMKSRDGLQEVLSATERILKRLQIDKVENRECFRRGFLASAIRQITNLLDATKKHLEKIEKVEVKKASVVKKQQKKPVPKAKRVKDVRYTETHPVLGTGRGATTIIDATDYFVYDGKNLRHYVAKKGEKLDVRGTTIINFDPELSKMKNIRKVENIKDIMKMSRSEKTKLFKEINSVEKPLNGRLNKECFLIF